MENETEDKKYDAVPEWHDQKGRFVAGNKYSVTRDERRNKHQDLEAAITSIADKFPPDRVGFEYRKLYDHIVNKLGKRNQKVSLGELRFALQVLEAALNRGFGKPVQRAEIKRQNTEHLIAWLQEGSPPVEEDEEQDIIDAEVNVVEDDAAIQS